jgi:pyrimidine deaminase RibD-like protein
MELAVREAGKAPSEDVGLHPLVGTVVSKDRRVLATAFRGELASGNHAEHVLLENKLREVSLEGATLYTTLEPCFTRAHPKIACAERIVERGVKSIFIGMLDPSPYLAGRAVRFLKDAGVSVEMFPSHLMKTIEELNAPFLQATREQAQVRISGYEWDLLESQGFVAGRSQQGWYEYFLATGDIANLERLKRFYIPPSEQVVQAQSFALASSDSPRLVVATDLRLIWEVTRDPDRLFSLTPRQFEHFTAELLERLGYVNVSVGKGSKDGGVDVSAYIKHPLGVERVIVQCKRHAPDHKVGEPVIKQLLADTDIHHAARGLMVTTSYLTRGARLLVDTFRYRLSALDHSELLAVLRGEQQPMPDVTGH